MKRWVQELLMLAAGCVLYTISTIWIDPVEIIPGNVLGISIICRALWGTRIGLVNFVVNVPVMLLCTLRFGKKILIYTIVILACTSLLIDVLLPVIPPLPVNAFVLTLIGGGTMGVGAGLLMRSGGTTGGSVAVSRIIHDKHPNISVGKIILAIDAFIVAGGAILLRSWKAIILSALYAVICSILIDAVYYGKNYGKVLRSIRDRRAK